MIRILIVDDHELVRTGFRMILAAQPDMEVVGEAGSAEEAIAKARQLKPDVVLMDVNLPGISGIEATERIVASDAGSKVLAVSMQEADPIPRRLISAGAAGFVGKACPANELVEAVRKISLGQKYLSSAVAQQMALSKLDPNAGKSPFDLLSKRELEVVRMLARGDSLTETASKLHIETKTAGTHKYRALEKLGVDNNVDLIHLALKWGLLDQA